MIALQRHHATIVAALVARGVPRDVASDCAGNFLAMAMDAAMSACDARGIDAWETVWRAADSALRKRFWRACHANREQARRAKKCE